MKSFMFLAPWDGNNGVGSHDEGQLAQDPNPQKPNNTLNESWSLTRGSNNADDNATTQTLREIIYGSCSCAEENG